MVAHLWYKDAVFYELYVRAFADSNGDGVGDLPGILSKLDYLQWLGIDTIWLLPISPSPMRDDGYDVADYCAVHPSYGVMEDFRRLTEEVHRRHMRIIIDLVVNHTSDRHSWFQASRDPNHPQHAEYRDWYVWSKTDRPYRDARVIFSDSLSSNWTFDPLRGEYFWHRFFEHQPDLNYDHIPVQQAMMKVAAFWLDQGVDGFRVDATPYLIEREGTNCDNLPETHAYLKRLRAFIDAYAPGKLLLSEANQWPREVLPYFGEGDEFHMNFHFPLMPRIYMALAKQDRSSIVSILEQTPDLPPGCQWASFLRCHDELTVEMVTDDERRFIWDFYAPEKRMRLNLGIRRRLAPLLQNDRRRIEVAYSILFTCIGSPVIYYGDEIGMGDNIWLDDRDGLRTPMQWTGEEKAGFSTAETGQFYLPLIDDEIYGCKKLNVADQQADNDSLLQWLRRLIGIRKQHPVFAHGTLEMLQPDSKAVLAYRRVSEQETILVVHNLSGEAQRVQVDAALLGREKPVQIFGNIDGRFDSDDRYLIELPAYAYGWFRLA